jgi:DNA ligase (NAD+)
MFVDKLPKFFQLLDDIGISYNKENYSNVTVNAHSPTQKHVISGMTIVFTGIRNKEWESTIESRGGKVATSVSKSTSLVVAKDPEDGSGKIKKAREAGVRIISSDQFQEEFI